MQAQQAETLTGICLRSVEYTEKARIATYFTVEKGKVDAILPHARGAKSRQAGACEAGHVFRVHMRPPRGNASLSRLEQYEVLQAFTPDASLHVETCQALFQTLEIFSALILAFQEEDDKRIQLLGNYQAMLLLWQHARREEDIQLPMAWLWQAILNTTGLIPSWGWDAVTHDALPFPLQPDATLYYDADHGGLTQQGCASTTAFRVSRGVYSTLRMLEHAQTLPLTSLLELPCPPLQTLHHTREFFVALLRGQNIYLKSTAFA